MEVTALEKKERYGLEVWAAIGKRKKKELAAAVGVSEATLSNYIHRRSRPGPEMLAKIAKELGVEPDQIDIEVGVGSGRGRVRTGFAFPLRLDEIEKAMQVRELSGYALAQRLGVSKQMVHQWLKGQTSPGTEKLARQLYKELGLDFDKPTPLDQIVAPATPERGNGEPDSLQTFLGPAPEGFLRPADSAHVDEWLRRLAAHERKRLQQGGGWSPSVADYADMLRNLRKMVPDLGILRRVLDRLAEMFPEQDRALRERKARGG